MITLNVHYDKIKELYTAYVYENEKIAIKQFNIDSPKIPVESDDVVLKSEYDERDEYTEPIWNCYGYLRALRLAGIIGLHLGWETIEQKSNITFNTHVMGYDIECASDNGGKSLPLPSDRITCASISCSCGYKVSYYVGYVENYDCKMFNNSRELAEEMHKDISAHSKPLWLVGYNNYSFDNLFMSYHDVNAPYINLQKKSTRGFPSLCFYDEGVNNVDLYLYLDARYRSMFPSMGLGVVAKTLEIGNKLDLPKESNAIELLDYNMIDSDITWKVFVHMKIEEQILSTCTVMRCCLYDVVRNATGAMCACMLSAYTFKDGNVMDWSKCTTLHEDFKGGMVYEPIVGFHNDVAVVDFSAMYPSIMMCASISHDNVEVFNSVDRPNDVWWDDDMTVYVTIDGRGAKFVRNRNCMSYKILGTLIKFRKEFGDKDPHLSTAIKAATNSLFGSLGFSSSPIYSPRASHSITAIGRKVLKDAKENFESCGMTVIYGDTDSLFLTCRGGRERVIAETLAGLDKFHKSLLPTPFAAMFLKHENTYMSLAITKKKNYALVRYSNVLEMKGVASRRKDRIGIVISTFNECATEMRRRNPLERSIAMGLILDRVITRISEGKCSPLEVGCEVRVYGVACIKYRNADGNLAYAEKSNMPDRLDYSVKEVMISLFSSLEDFLTVCTQDGKSEILRGGIARCLQSLG